MDRDTYLQLDRIENKINQIINTLTEETNNEENNDNETDPDDDDTNINLKEITD